MPTVKQLIESLSKYPMDAKVEVVLTQYNKVGNVAYLPIRESFMVKDLFATMQNGVDVRISCALPDEGNTFTILSTRKK